MATVNGEYKKIFGWETDAHGEEYGEFLKIKIENMTVQNIQLSENELEDKKIEISQKDIMNEIEILAKQIDDNNV